MNPLIDWAQRYNVSPQAMRELQTILTVDENVKQVGGVSEAAVASRVRLRASQFGIRLFRNNVGACQSEDGRQIRYGLANDSKRMNQQIKSSDLIGITPVFIGPHHVGKMLGVFTSIETKKAEWQYRGKGREVQQKRWIDAVNSCGGIGLFANNENVIDEIRSNTK